jgi:hypothetical protein
MIPYQFLNMQRNDEEERKKGRESIRENESESGNEIRSY